MLKIIIIIHVANIQYIIVATPRNVAKPVTDTAVQVDLEAAKKEKLSTEPLMHCMVLHY